MGHSFKLSKNLDANKNKRMDYSLILMIVFIIVAIASMIICFVMLNKKEEVAYIDKKNAKKDYVYTVKKEVNITSDGEKNSIPAINISNSKIDTINSKILTNYSNVSNSGEYTYNYDYSINDQKNILSLAVKYSYMPEGITKMITYCDTYNVDLVTGDVITDDELLEKYDITKSKLKQFVQAKFEDYYRQLVKKKYYTEKECDYNCFLKNRGLNTNYLNGTSLYVKDNSLILFKYFFTVSKYHEEEFFKDNNYELVVKKAD